MKPIKNSSKSKAHGIWFHKHSKTSKFPQLRMQSQDEDFMRSKELHHCSSKHLTMYDHIIDNDGLCPKVANPQFSHSNCIGCYLCGNYLTCIVPRKVLSKHIDV